MFPFCRSTDTDSGASSAAASRSARASAERPLWLWVLQVYEEELRENPDNYSVLLMRADEYYRHQEYIRWVDVHCARKHFVGSAHVVFLHCHFCLSNAVTAAPQVGLYRYLRAGIAQSHYHYLAALKDYEYIIEQRIYNYHGIYGSIPYRPRGGRAVRHPVHCS